MRRRARSGSALLLAIFFLVVLFLLAQAFHALLPTELTSALRFNTDTHAYFVADAAIEDTVAYVEHELENGRELVLSSGASLTRSGSLGDWSWSAVIEPDPQTPPRGFNPLRNYKVTATASQGGRAYRRITTWLGQQSFAKFAFYSDKVPSYLYKPVDQFHYDGPFHTNDPLTLYVPPGFYRSGLPPTFTSTVTTATAHPGSPDGIAYAGPGGPPYDGAGNPNTSLYDKIYTGGREAVRSPVRSIEMPPNTDALMHAALGDLTITPPSSVGVHVNTASGSNQVAGGVYIVGNVDSMVLVADANGNRSMRIQQGGRMVTVTETLANPVTAPNGEYVAQNSTLVVGPGNHTEVFRGTTNGVVFSTGSIESLQGVNRGARTIATNVNAQTEIVPGGNITRADTPLGQKPQDGGDNLGLVTWRLRLPTTIPRSLGNPLWIYGAILAGDNRGGGGFQVDDYANPWRGKGIFHIVGSFSVSMKGPEGTFDYYSGQPVSGFHTVSQYDSNLAVMPPPYFPTFAKLNVRSWKEEPLGR
jgi:hypothetical protein